MPGRLVYTAAYVGSDRACPAVNASAACKQQHVHAPPRLPASVDGTFATYIAWRIFRDSRIPVSWWTNNRLPYMPL